MIFVAGHNIYTEGGFGSRVIYDQARRGVCHLRLREGLWDIPEPFFASILPREDIEERFAAIGSGDGLTPLEKAMILSARDAVAMAGIDAASPKTLFVISSTKGNIGMLETSPDGTDPVLPIWRSAAQVAAFFGNPNRPLCVTNACTSGLCAQIDAARAVDSGRYDTAVVIGADFLSRFIVAGFQSLKALSPVRCRPFDAERVGLNLSEAVATVVLTAEPRTGTIAFEAGCIRNDANHISAPSRTAVGQIAAIDGVLQQSGREGIAFVNVHGTATIYNDGMESIALHETGLDSLPVVSYKSLFGHTLGAAGVLETILSLFALEEQVVLPVATYRTSGVNFPLNIDSTLRPAAGDRFLKIMSGFGGINAAAMFRRV